MIEETERHNIIRCDAIIAGVPCQNKYFALEGLSHVATIQKQAADDIGWGTRSVDLLTGLIRTLDYCPQHERSIPR